MIYATFDQVLKDWRRNRLTISIALFPYDFTVGARIVGEVSCTLEKPICTDQMVLQKMSEQLNIKITDLQERLFTRTHKASRLSIEKEKLIACARHFIDQIQSEVSDYLYYGYFTSLIDADYLIKWAEKQEHLAESNAKMAIRDYDLKAACWARFMYDRDPYDPSLFDTVIRYECQDLFDVITYICMKYIDHLLERSPHHLRSY